MRLCQGYANGRPSALTMSFHDGELVEPVFMERASGDDPGDAATENEDASFAGSPLLGDG